MANKSKIVESLKELVNKARGLIDTVEESPSTTSETLKNLYPSTSGGKAGSKRKMKYPMQLLKDKKKPKKASQLKESLKDFFFLLHGTSKVPRKNAREFYYENGLVATAISINSGMGEVQMREMIREQIPVVFERKPFTDFTFVKPVGDKLVTTDNVLEWDYKTIRHIYGNGPVYVRADHPIGIDFSQNFQESSDDESNEKENIDLISTSNQQLSSTSNQQLRSTSNQQLRSIPSSSRKDSKSIDDYFKPSALCPICYGKFNKEDLQLHASQCAERKYDFIDYSSTEEMSDKEDGDQTLPYEANDDDTQIDVYIAERDATLETLMEKQKSTKDEFLKCRRAFIWDDFCSHRKKPWSHPENTLSVTFLMESAVDDGGPKREFFSECLRHISTTILLNGTPVESLYLLQRNQFKRAGELIGMSLLQSGIKPENLTEWCFDVISSSKSLDPSYFEPSEDFKNSPIISKIVNATTEQEYRNILLEDDVFDLLANIGYAALPSKEKLSDREEVLKLLYFKARIEPKLPALAQLADGLAIHGLLESIRKNPKGFRSIFVLNNSDVTVGRFCEELQPEFSLEGSNRFTVEQAVFKHFIDYIDKCSNDDEATYKVKDVIKFITGSNKIPIHGFKNKISVNFKHSCEEKCRCLPTVSTCGLSIDLPVHLATLETMELQMNKAITEAPFFGRV